MNTGDLSRMHQLDAIEAAAYRDMFENAPRALAGALGIETREVAGATLLMAPGMPTPMFNRVIGLGNEFPATDDALDAIGDVYRDAGTGEWWLHLTPGAQPAGLEATLTARGFVQASRPAWAKVVRDRAPPAPVETALDIRLVMKGEEPALGETLCLAFEMPGAWGAWFSQLASLPQWRAVGAFDHGKMVGGGLLYLNGNEAWLGAGGVLPAARRQHAHRALMTLRIQLAIDAGCDQIATETGEPVNEEPNPSLRNMYASGFVKAFLRRNYAAPTSVPPR